LYTGTLVLALGQNLATNAESAGSTDLLSLIVGASLLVKIILAILVLFSAGSWGIIVSKKMQFSRAAKDTAAFLDVFRKSSRFSEVHAVCDSLSASPLVGLFQAGYAELNAQLRAVGEAKPGAGAARPTLKSLEAVDRALIRAATTEVSKFEHRASFLATTASITPCLRSSSPSFVIFRASGPSVITHSTAGRSLSVLASIVRLAIVPPPND